MRAIEAIKLELPILPKATSPIIGITCTRTSKGYTMRSEYEKAIREAGGIPVILPYMEAELVFKAVEGIVFTGGGDIDPKHYGEEMKVETGNINESQDKFELELCREAVRANIPMLLICRGMQIMNVSMGGTLNQHIEGHKKTAEQTHEIETIKGTQTAELMRGINAVNSRHHQSVNKLGEGIIITAKATDGVIEAIEIPKNKFTIGVQWHPEDMISERPEMLKLFERLVRASE